jgi:hypothetical protein
MLYVSSSQIIWTLLQQSIDTQRTMKTIDDRHPKPLLTKDRRKMQNNLDSLHHQAIELVDRSILAKQQGDEEGSLDLLRSP